MYACTYKPSGCQNRVEGDQLPSETFGLIGGRLKIDYVIGEAVDNDLVCSQKLLTWTLHFVKHVLVRLQRATEIAQYDILEQVGVRKCKRIGALNREAQEKCG